MTQTEEPRTQKMELRVIENYFQILKQIKITIFSWMDVRIVTEQGLLDDSHFLPFCVGKYTAIPLHLSHHSILGVWRHITGLFSFTDLQIQRNSILEPVLQELYPRVSSTPEPDLNSDILDLQLILSWDETLRDPGKG